MHIVSAVLVLIFTVCYNVLKWVILLWHNDPNVRKEKSIMDVQKAIVERRSTRGFEDTKLTESEIKTLIDAALASPTVLNRQPWHFAFVTDKAAMEEMDEVMRELFTIEFGEKSEKRHFYNAPLFVAITCDPAEKSRYTKIECGIAVENIALSAKGLGLGSVIIATPDIAFISEKGAYFKQKMGIPVENDFIIGIVIGHNNVSGAPHAIRENRYTIV